MIDKKLKIDPNEFALAVVGGTVLQEDDDIKASKAALKRYLSAYMLIEEFNNLEASQFSMLKKADRELLAKALDGMKFD